jgi:rhodanese-related sulfurtransferase
VAALCLGLSIIATGQAGAEQPAAVTEMVDRARQQVPRLDRAAFAQVLDRIAQQPRPALVIDVREPDEFAAGHIPGAINIPRGVLEFRIWPRLDTLQQPAGEIELYLYCGWGSRAVLAAGSLQQLGLNRVVAVDMSLADWQAAGLPFTSP